MSIDFVIHERLHLFCSLSLFCFVGGVGRFLGPQTPENPLSHQQPVSEKSYLPALFLNCTKKPPHIFQVGKDAHQRAFVLGLSGELSTVGIAEGHPKRFPSGKCHSGYIRLLAEFSD